MRVLLYSTVLYLLGIAVVLYVRPALMFRSDGRWKEFGIHSVETTVFSFWMFCIIWAVVTFAVTSFLFSDGPVDTVKSAVAMASLTSRINQRSPLPISAESVDSALTPIGNTSSPQTSSGATPVVMEETKAGYYKLDDSMMKKGIPRYIYVGAEMPPELEDN
jgi:hypothetical protein